MNDLRAPLGLFLRRFMLALQNGTRFRGLDPGEPGPSDPGLLQASTAHLPGVGWVLGVLACLVFATASLVVGGPWAPAVAAVASTMAIVALTGALHEGALFRMAHSLQPRGPDAGWGTVTLVLVLAAKVTLLAALATASEPALVAALFAGHVVSRFALVVTQWAASSDAGAQPVRTGALWCIVPLLLMVPAGGIAFLLVPVLTSALATFALLRFCRSRPDAPATERPGAAQQVSELAFYLGAAMAT